MSSLVDRSALLDRFDQDLEFLAETLEILESDGPKLLDAIRGAAASGDAEAAARKAHALKGMVSNFSAPAATQEILEIESSAREGTLDGIAQKLDRFADCFESLCAEVRAIACGGPS